MNNVKRYIVLSRYAPSQSLQVLHSAVQVLYSTVQADRLSTPHLSQVFRIDP
jgi:hypothetical protein